MKVILLLLALLAVTLCSEFAADDKCPHDLEVLCIDDINKAYPIC
jgi:hypothetical protein